MTDIFELTRRARRLLNLRDEPEGLVSVELAGVTVEARPGGHLKVLWADELIVHSVDHLVQEFHPEHLKIATDALKQHMVLDDLAEV